MYGQAEHRIEVATRIAVMAGCVVINCNYRKCPETKFPMPVFDAYAIFKQVVRDAASLGIDPDKIGLLGESAGACICMGVAQELVKRKEQKLASLVVINWPMIGSKLCGGPKSDWTDYELAFRDQDKFYEAMSTDLQA